MDAVADALGQRVGGFCIAMLDELVPLQFQEAELSHTALTVEDAQLYCLIAHDREILRSALDLDPGPGGELVCDLIDERSSAGHEAHRTRSDSGLAQRPRQVLVARRRWGE